MNKSHLLINEPSLQVLPSLAKAVGLDEAIVLQQLHYWINNPKAEGRIDENGEKWIYNTYAEWQEDNFPFWSEDKIQRIFLSLEKQGVVISAQLDAKKRDMRKFYRIAYDQLCVMDDAILRPSNTAKLHDVKMNQRLPENKSILQNADPAWTILAGQEITEEQVKTVQLRDVAPKMFEKALGFSKPLPWWDGDKDWRELGEWVCAEYNKDRTSFGRYNTWRNTKYTKGGIANTRLRGFPSEFSDSWDMFKQSEGEQRKTEDTRPEYKPFMPPQEDELIPNPKATR